MTYLSISCLGCWQEKRNNKESCRHTNKATIYPLTRHTQVRVRIVCFFYCWSSSIKAVYASSRLGFELARPIIEALVNVFCFISRKLNLRPIVLVFIHCRKCCNPETCQFTPNAVCDVGDCCENCQFLKKGAECRPSGGECDFPEFCTGSSFTVSKISGNFWVLPFASHTKSGLGFSLQVYFEGLCRDSKSPCADLQKCKL